jgi:hypothetical protein
MTKITWPTLMRHSSAKLPSGQLRLIQGQWEFIAEITSVSFSKKNKRFTARCSWVGVRPKNTAEAFALAYENGAAVSSNLPDDFKGTFIIDTHASPSLEKDGYGSFTFNVNRSEAQLQDKYSSGLIVRPNRAQTSRAA